MENKKHQDCVLMVSKGFAKGFEEELHYWNISYDRTVEEWYESHLMIYEFKNVKDFKIAKKLKDFAIDKQVLYFNCKRHGDS